MKYVTGSMQGARGEFYYRRKGSDAWVFVGYLTRTPEAGEIKAIFSGNNEEVGRFSTSTEVTLS